MAKAMSIAGMVIGGLLAFVFAFDLALGFPFSGANALMDIGMFVAAAALGYLSWNAYADVR